MVCNDWFDSNEIRSNWSIGDNILISPLARLSDGIVIIFAFFFLLFPLTFIGEHIINAYFETFPEKGNNRKDEIESHVSAMRTVKEKVIQMEESLTQLEQTVKSSSNSLLSKTRAVKRSFALFDTRFSDALVDFDDDENDDDVQ